MNSFPRHIFECGAKDFEHPCFGMHFREGEPDCTFFPKARALCQARPAVREQVNQLTAFVDASGIYGNNDVDADRLRRNDGKNILFCA